MRRTALLLLTAFFPLLSIQVNAQTKKGDLNGDGNVGKEDVTCLIYKILGLAEGNDAYDVNEDGKTDIADVTCLIGIIASNQQGMPFQTCPDDHHPHMIDLGLPSGVKWACCNVGASKPENYGGYYAWGETEVKNDYSFETYIHCDGTQETCHYLGNITGTAYDVAHVKWGEAWRMPTIAERDELIRNCSVETITLYDKFFDKYTGPNGSFIIIPYGGNMYSSINLHEGSDVHSWTSEPLENGQSAHYLYKNGLIGSCLTCMGLTVRPVYDPSFFFSLSEDTVDVFVNSMTSVSIEMGSGEYELQYDQTDIIDAEFIMADKEEYPDAKDEISIFGIAEGTATLHVLDKKNNKTATLVVNVKTPTDDDVAVTMEYIQRVRDFINIQEELEVNTFQNNLITWLEEQDWVKRVNVSFDNNMTVKTLRREAKRNILKPGDGLSLIDMTFKNNAKFTILFYDMSLSESDESIDNWEFAPFTSHDVSSDVSEDIIDNPNVLYIQGRTMPSFAKQNISTAEKEYSLIGQAKQLSPVNFDITPEFKSLAFLENDNLSNYSMILLGQTHGCYDPRWKKKSENDYAMHVLTGAFQVEDQNNILKSFNCGLTLAIENKMIAVSKTEPIVCDVSPQLLTNCNIKNKTIFYGNYCYSYLMENAIPQTTFFGYNTKGWYQKGTNQMTEFFYNMSMGDTYDKAIKTMLEDDYVTFTGDNNVTHIIPATNKINSKQRYFSISTEEVTEYSETGTPIIKGQIKGYHNLKPKILYYVYAYGKNAVLNYSDIVTKGKLINYKANNGEGIYEDGSFSFDYIDLPITQTPEEYNVIVGFFYGGTNYYGPIKTLKTKSLCPDEHHPHAIDLGLPSGTKWACCNVDDEREKECPTNYGGYYAWGETEEKSVYKSVNYKHMTGKDIDEDGMYDSWIYYDLGFNICGSVYDAAFVNWGQEWSLPSSVQAEELVNNCSSRWILLNGVRGTALTSYNGNTIFLPCAGTRDRTYCHDFNNLGQYTTGSSVTGKDMIHLYVGYRAYVGCEFIDWRREWGRSIRPVKR